MNDNTQEKLDARFQTMSDQAKHMALSQQEKEQMFLRVMKFMQDNPVVVAPKKETTFTAAHFLNFLTTPLVKAPMVRYGILAFAVMICGGVGVAFAAQQSLPGDPLYSVKTEVNEKVLGSIILNNEAKAAYNLGLVQLRLEEAEKVIAKNNFDDTKGVRLQALLDNHIADIKKDLNSSQNQQTLKVATGINSELEASLQAHSKVLSRLVANNKKDTKAADTFLMNVSEKADIATKSRQNDEQALSSAKSADLKVSAQNKMELAQRKLASLVASINANANISAETQATLRQQVKVISDSLEKGQGQFEASQYIDALVTFQQVIGSIQQVNVGVRAATDLGIQSLLQIGVQNSDGNQSDAVGDILQQGLDLQGKVQTQINQ